MLKSGMLISAPSTPSANDSTESIFGTSDAKLAWRNFTAASSAQAPPGHYCSTHPGRLVGYPLPVSAKGSARRVNQLVSPQHSARLQYTAIQPPSEMSVGVWWLVHELMASCRSFTIRPLLTAPVAGLWAVSITNCSRHRQYRVAGIGEDAAQFSSHARRRSRARAIQASHGPSVGAPKTQIAQRQSGLVFNSRPNVP